MDKFGFEETRQRIIETNRQLLTLLSVQAQNYFVKSFTNQGFNDKPWKEVQRRDPKTRAYKYPLTKGLQRRTAPILTGAGYKHRGGTLRRAVGTMSSTAQITGMQIRMTVDVPYAQIHNDGGIISKRSRSAVVHFGNNGNRVAFSTKKNATFAQKVSIGAHTITIPQRQFIGQTQELMDMQRKKITNIVSRVWGV